jgi:amidophosphoribosyltransferase
MKLNPLRENLEGRRVVVVDDSIVRGTTQKQLVKMLREAGAVEVHLRITSPPVRWPCFYGIDTGQRGELLAAQLTVDQIRDYLDVDTLAYLSLDRLVAATGAVGAGFCDACFSGQYPTEVGEGYDKNVLEVDADTALPPQPTLSLFDGDDLLPADEAAGLSGDLGLDAAGPDAGASPDGDL